MSDEQPDETPDTPPDSLADYIKANFGEDADKLFGSLETDPMQEAWIAFHEFYKGLLVGGFSAWEATEITASYLYRIFLGGGQG